MILNLRQVAATLVLFCSLDVLQASTLSDTLQQQARQRFRRGVDTALALLGMRSADLTMPPDLMDRDPHRTMFHDSLFSDPLGTADWTDSIATAMISREDLALRTLSVGPFGRPANTLRQCLKSIEPMLIRYRDS